MIQYSEFEKVQNSLMPKGDYKEVLDYLIEKVICNEIYKNLMSEKFIVKDFSDNVFINGISISLKEKIIIPKNMINFHKTKSYIVKHIKEIFDKKGWEINMKIMGLDTEQNGLIKSIKVSLNIKKKPTLTFSDKINNIMTKIFFDNDNS